MYQSLLETHRRGMNRRTLNFCFRCGGFHVLPPTSTYLRTTCKKLIDNWYVGNKREKIPLLQILSALNVVYLGTPGNRNAGKLKLRQMRCLMPTLGKYEKKEIKYLSNKALWTSEYVKIMWEKIGEKDLISKFDGQNGNGEMSWKTMYKNMLKAKVLIQGWIKGNSPFVT